MPKLREELRRVGFEPTNEPLEGESASRALSVVSHNPSMLDLLRMVVDSARKGGYDFGVVAEYEHHRYILSDTITRLTLHLLVNLVVEEVELRRLSHDTVEQIRRA